GQLPFRGETAVSTLMLAATANPNPISKLNPALPPALSDLVQRLMAKNPQDRPASAQTVVEELERIERRLVRAHRLAKMPAGRLHIAVAVALVLVAVGLLAQVAWRITHKYAKIANATGSADSRSAVTSPEQPTNRSAATMETWRKQIAALPASQQVEK